MAERKTKVMHNDKMVDAVDVPVVESNERWSELKLEDGSILRVKVNVFQVLRIDGEYDPQGNPSYILNMSAVMGVIEAPDALKRKSS